MSLQLLYQQAIKQHSHNPIGNNINFSPTHSAEGYNASCGDELNLYLQLSGTEPLIAVETIGFDSDACAICTASASLLCEHSLGKKATQLRQDIYDFTQTIENNTTLTIESIKCLTAVSSHPSRRNCALLPWKTLLEALDTPVITRLKPELEM